MTGSLWIKRGGYPPVDRFDFHVPLLSLPGRLKTQLDTIPDKIPYLTADPALCLTWKNRIGGGDAFKVGLVWAAVRTIRTTATGPFTWHV